MGQQHESLVFGFHRWSSTIRKWTWLCFYVPRSPRQTNPGQGTGEVVGNGLGAGSPDNLGCHGFCGKMVISVSCQVKRKMWEFISAISSRAKHCWNMIASTRAWSVLLDMTWIWKSYYDLSWFRRLKCTMVQPKLRPRANYYLSQWPTSRFGLP